MERRSTARAPRSLSQQVGEDLAERIRSGQLAPGARLPTESALMIELGVSRTVVREALSQLQASNLVETRHGVGTFVVDDPVTRPFSIRPRQLATLQDVVAVLELRLGLETEAAGLAALRRTDRHLSVMREALDAFDATLAQGGDAVAADFRFHREIARATGNVHFAGMIDVLGTRIIPRARLEPEAGAATAVASEERLSYLRRVNAEHENIFEAIARQDPDAARAAMRTHLTNSRERRRRDFPARG